jgi:hypothetical protein
VFFKRDDGARFWLGTFALYPVDHPGHFIVPTKGRVRAGGSLVVSMAVPGPGADPEGNRVRVGIGGIALLPR